MEISELKKTKDFLEMFGQKPWPTLGRSLGEPPGKQIEIEPWMVEFRKGKHSLEAWDAFYEYCNAGPLKRAYCRFAGLMFEILRIL